MPVFDLYSRNISAFDFPLGGSDGVDGVRGESEWDGGGGASEGRNGGMVEEVEGDEARASRKRIEACFLERTV
jgi:hypothetical protein